jgi:hypothetical protein
MAMSFTCSHCRHPLQRREARTAVRAHTPVTGGQRHANRTVTDVFHTESGAEPMTESRQSRSLLGRITPCVPDVVPRAHQVHERRSTSPPARRRSGSPRPHLRPDFTWATLRPDGEQDKSSRRLEDCDQPHNGCISIDSRGRRPMASGVSCKATHASLRRRPNSF